MCSAVNHFHSTSLAFFAIKSCQSPPQVRAVVTAPLKTYGCRRIWRRDFDCCAHVQFESKFTTPVNMCYTLDLHAVTKVILLDRASRTCITHARIFRTCAGHVPAKLFNRYALPQRSRVAQVPGLVVGGLRFEG